MIVRVEPAEQLRYIEQGTIRRCVRMPRGAAVYDTFDIPQTTIVCHGEPAPFDRAAFARTLEANRAPVKRIVFARSSEAIAAVRAEMEIRGDRYLALVRAGSALSEGWLDELIAQVECSPAVGAASCANACCTLLALAQFPQHERLRECGSLDAAVSELLAGAVQRGIVTRTGGTSAEPIERARSAQPVQRGLVSIVMLSWNAPEFTKLALESIRSHTSGNYEVIVVDNGSRAETVDWLKTLTGVRVIFNPTNRGFAGGNNQAIAAARGDYIVLLNNDVVVTAGWLDGLLGAFERVPGLGVSAPRSNKIAGDQIVIGAAYADMAQMHRFAAARRERYRDRGYMTDRAIGLCLCIDRRVVEEIGGIDERFGIGNFEDDDFCLRVRAAGYRIYVCDDVFIHHFGSQTFAANKIDWTATMRENWLKFAAKWDLPQIRQGGGYVPGPAIRRGFVRDLHYVALPRQPQAREDRTYDVVFTATVRDESDWNRVGAFAGRYLRAFDADHAVLLAIAALGDLPAQTIGARLERFAQRAGMELHTVADIDVSEQTDDDGRIAATARARHVRIEDLRDASPSGLRRYLLREVPA